TPGDPLPALEHPSDERVRLQLLEQVVHRELGIAVVEADDHADREHVLAHRVDERAAELAILGPGPKRPAHRVHDAAQRTLDLPDLFHPERPDLRALPLEAERVERDTGQVPLRALAEDGHAREDVRAGLEVREPLAVPAPALVARADAEDASVLHEQLLRRGLGQDRDAGLLRLLAEPAGELR